MLLLKDFNSNALSNLKFDFLAWHSLKILKSFYLGKYLNIYIFPNNYCYEVIMTLFANTIYVNLVYGKEKKGNYNDQGKKLWLSNILPTIISLWLIVHLKICPTGNQYFIYFYIIIWWIFLSFFLYFTFKLFVMC